MAGGEFARWHTEVIELASDLAIFQLSRLDSDGRRAVMARGSESRFDAAKSQAGQIYRALIRAWLDK